MQTLSLSYIIKAINNYKLECVRKMREIKYTVNINRNRRTSKGEKQEEIIQAKLVMKCVISYLNYFVLSNKHLKQLTNPPKYVKLYTHIRDAFICKIVEKINLIWFFFFFYQN